MQTLFTFYKTSYLNEEVNRTEPSPSVSVPSSSFRFEKSFYVEVFEFQIEHWAKYLDILGWVTVWATF